MDRIIFIFPLLLAAPAFAQNSGGYAGPDNRPLVTAAEATSLADDSRITVRGYLVESLGDEEYRFEDSTGSLIVEIDDEVWRDIRADESTEVELSGELDVEGDRRELDVDRVRRPGP